MSKITLKNKLVKRLLNYKFPNLVVLNETEVSPDDIALTHAVAELILIDFMNDVESNLLATSVLKQSQ